MTKETRQRQRATWTAREEAFVREAARQYLASHPEAYQADLGKHIATRLAVECPNDIGYLRTWKAVVSQMRLLGVNMPTRRQVPWTAEENKLAVEYWKAYMAAHPSATQTEASKHVAHKLPTKRTWKAVLTQMMHPNRLALSSQLRNAPLEELRADIRETKALVRALAAAWDIRVELATPKEG